MAHLIADAVIDLEENGGNSLIWNQFILKFGLVADEPRLRAICGDVGLIALIEEFSGLISNEDFQTDTHYERFCTTSDFNDPNSYKNTIRNTR